MRFPRLKTDGEYLVLVHRPLLQEIVSVDSGLCLCYIHSSPYRSGPRPPLLSSLTWAHIIYMIVTVGGLRPDLSSYKSRCLHPRFVSFNTMSAIVIVFTTAVCSLVIYFLAADQNASIDPLQYIALVGASVFWLQIYLCTIFVLAVRGPDLIAACGLLFGLALLFFIIGHLLTLDFEADPDLLMPDTGFLIAVMRVSIVLLAVSEIMAHRYADLYDSDSCESRGATL